ncbi:MAG: hypothetical protein JNM12_10290 [Alphaproteobacteria bacterium]|nr:hypothetical protein [Alphaproteobacteria bacterium]
MTQDTNEQIRDRYIGEYIADAGANKPGILGKIWRSARSIKEHLDVVKKADPQAHALLYVGAAVMMLSLLGGAPAIGVAVVAAGIGYTGGLVRANGEVRREAETALTRDIADGTLAARFAADTQKPGLQPQQISTLQQRGQAAAQFAATADSAAPEADPLPAMRGIERPHGRNFG